MAKSTAAKPAETPVRKWPVQWFVIGGIVLVVEFTLKYLAWLYRIEGVIIDIPDIASLNIVYVENRHSAFGMMRSVPQWVNTGLLGLSVVFLTGITIQQINSPDSTEMMRRGIFCFVVGAIGNMVDRLTVGAVVDYVDIRLGENGSFYALAWNISDLVINVGFAHVIIESFKPKKKIEEEKKSN